MRIVSDRLSARWYVGYDLFETLPDHSSLTRIRDRFGLPVFREFFERIVELCVEAGLVWGKELYFDATKVDANASLDSVAPRFYVEEHLDELFTEDELPNPNQEDGVVTGDGGGDSPVGNFYELSSARDERYVDRVKSYRGTFAYEKALRKRRVWVEPLFGEAKDWHGLRRFRLRRLEKVNIEALLIASGQNIKRLVAALERGPRKLAQAAALRPPDLVSRSRSHVSGRWPSLTGAKAFFNRLTSQVPTFGA